MKITQRRISIDFIAWLTDAEITEFYSAVRENRKVVINGESYELTSLPSMTGASQKPSGEYQWAISVCSMSFDEIDSSFKNNGAETKP